MNVPKPYQGNEKFIFISYSHRDTDKVFPIINALMKQGYRVWYDQGIDPGTEWDENIANHIADCGYFVAFISNNYLGSSNCKDELNFARDLEKDRLIVYLEEVQLPAGMAMRINRLQSIFKYTYTNEADFYEKLFAANNIGVCLGEGSCSSDAAFVADGGSNDNINVGSQSASYNTGTVNTNVFGPVKSKKKAALLALFLGGVGAHKFYLGKRFFGVICFLLLWVYCISVVFGIIDAIKLFTMSDAVFMAKYNCRVE